MDVAAKRFFSLPYFAVVGASQDKTKFGYKILAWYHAQGLPVTPVNPTRTTIDLPSQSYSTVPDVKSLPKPTDTALSFLTPPSVTLRVLEDAQRSGITAVWLQPGSFDDESVAFAKQNFESFIGGFDEGTVGGEGWCVLVDGGNALQAAGRTTKPQKL